MFDALFNKKSSLVDSIARDFKDSESSKQFPALSLSILSGLSLIMSKKKYRDILSNPISFIKHEIVENDQIQTLEPQSIQRPTVLFDFKNFLYTDRFSLARFDMVPLKRYFCEEFLFNIAHYYEIISVTDGLPVVSDRILSKIDPFGCIKYRIYLKDKRSFGVDQLNRELSKLIVISTTEDEFHKDFDDNTLRISPFTEKHDTKLTDMMHFLINLHYSNSKTDFRNIIKSYKDVDFFVTFRKIQQKLFSQRNLLSFNRFETQLKKINQEKITEYANFKNKVGIPDDRTTKFKDIVYSFIKTVVF